MRVEKQIKLWTKKGKTPQEVESEDELPRVHPSEQEGLKHRLIDFDAAPVLVRLHGNSVFSKLNLSR